MTIREGKWKCTYCDAMNRGRDLRCAGCGATRERDVQFIYDESAPEVADANELSAARSGPEWICETCGTSNPSERGACRQCGAERGASASRDVKMVEPPVAAQSAAAPPSSFASRLAPGGKVSRKFGCGLLVVLLTLCSLCGGIGYYLQRTHDAQLVVASVEWERTVEVEELQTVTEQAWDDAVPSDARVVSRRNELRRTDRVQTGTRAVEEEYDERVQTGTRRVKTGTRDLGNGYFEDVYKDEPVYDTRRRTRTVQKPVYRDVPVYGQKVTYQVNRWRAVRTERARGQDNSPSWPPVPSGAKLRGGKRAEKYLVRLRDSQSGKTYDREVSAEEFARYTPGSIWRAQINNMGELKDLSPQ